MEEKKLTDEAIIKALEVCLRQYKDCNDCPLVDYDDCTFIRQQALDLIHRLQNEKKELKKELRLSISNRLSDCSHCKASEENAKLKDEKEQIKLFNLAIENGEIDMSIESEIAKSFYNSIIQVFEQNGAKNFFTTTVDIDGKKGRYAFTIEKVGGQTVAEKLAEQKAEIERLTEDWKQRINKARQRQFNGLKKEELASAYENLIESLEGELESRQNDYVELQTKVDDLKQENSVLSVTIGLQEEIALQSPIRHELSRYKNKESGS